MTIFLLGDSRTGTTSIHQWFLDHGIRSIHYFVREAGLTEPLHRHRKANWPRLRTFIRESGFEAFTDYPTRAFFREIVHEFPAAHFILSVRKDISTWRTSMLHGLKGNEAHIEFLTAFYVAWNEEIRALCAETGARFIEICIDDDDGQNGQKLATFVGIPVGQPLKRLHGTPSAAQP